MEADDLRCSRNARPQKALVGRAHDGSPPGRHSDYEGKMKIAFGKLLRMGIDHLPRKT